jgi:hypothetical protein
MSFFIQLLETFAVLVPDFLTLGLVASVFFSLCCMAKTLGIGGAVDNDLPLKISVAVGYLITITIHIFGTLQTPARPTITTSSPPESRVEQAGRESLSGPRKSQPVGREGAVIGS